jgi:hypothetical protein
MCMILPFGVGGMVVDGVLSARDVCWCKGVQICIRSVCCI